MNDRDLLSLVSAYLDGSLTEPDAAALNEWIKASDANAQRFVELTYIHRRLHDTLIDADADLVPDSRTIASAREKSPSVLGRLSVVYGLAAALLLTAAIVAAYTFVVSGESVGPEATVPSIATLIDTDGDVIIGNEIGVSGRDYAAHPIAIDRGGAEFQFVSGAQLRVAGPARMRMDTPMRVAVLRGHSTFNCPPRAVGFTVVAPGCRVVDLGTEFSVDVDDDGGSLVHVDTGRVAVHTLLDGIVSLDINEVAEVTADGRLVGVYVRSDLRPTDAIVLVGRGESSAPLGPLPAEDQWRVGVGGSRLTSERSDANLLLAFDLPESLGPVIGARLHLAKLADRTDSNRDLAVDVVGLPVSTEPIAVIDTYVPRLPDKPDTITGRVIARGVLGTKEPDGVSVDLDVSELVADTLASPHTRRVWIRLSPTRPLNLDHIDRVEIDPDSVRIELKTHRPTEKTSQEKSSPANPGDTHETLHP